MMLATCVSTARSASQSRWAIPALVRPSAMSARASRSLEVSVVSGSARRVGASSVATTSGPDAQLWLALA
jgi:hypothetical protein